MTINTKVLQLDGRESNTIELPPVFQTPFRPEVIHRVYVNLLSHTFQRQGRYPVAGEMVSAQSRGVGLGIARLARARGEGFSRAGQAAGVAGVRHGRAPHPPESWRKIYKKINKKEKKLGLCSAIAATARKDIIENRGHNLGNISNFPIIVSDDIESISKTKDLRKALVALGLGGDLARCDLSRKARSGTARRRGRKARSALSVLIVVSNNVNIGRLSGSISGVDIQQVKRLSVLDLTPGLRSIRLTVFSERAIKQLNNLNTPSQKVLEMIRGR